MDNIITRMVQMQQEGTPFVLCLIINTVGSVPRKPGSKMLVAPDGNTTGSVGGGAMEKQVIADALEFLQNPRTVVKTYHRNGHSEKEAAEVSVYMEVFAPAAQLFIFGAGHVGRAIAEKAAGLQFRIHLIDPRKELLDNISIPGIKCLHDDYVAAARKIGPTASHFVVITTHSHDADREVLALMAPSPASYVGMIGSRKKVEQTRQYLLENKLTTAAQLEKVDMPMGIPIAAESPEEIAISVLARLIAIKNRQKSKESAQ